MKSREDRGVRPDSLTSQLRALAKQKPRKRPQPLLKPLSASGSHSKTRDDDMLMDITSLQKQVQSPLRLQWLVDDFVKAAGAGDLRKVDQYIRGGIPIDRNHSVLHYSALHAAAALEKDEITKVLMQAGANVNATTKDRDSALHMAARYGKPAVAQEILRHSAEMKSPNNLGFTPMEIAADRQDHELKRLLEPPPNAPTAVHAQAVSSTSLTVAWTSSFSTASTYLFKVTWVLCESAGEFTEECLAPFYRICNLLPASKYQVTVQAGNHTVGWSESSPPVTFQTDDDVPNAMIAPKIIEVSDCFIRMRIQLPQSNGSEITRVSIQSQCTGTIASVTTSSFRRLLKPQDHEHVWESIISDVSLLRNCDTLATTGGATSTIDVDGILEGYREFVSTGLAPGRVYYFRVKAWNQCGWSPDGEISDGICTNDCPKMVTKAARSMQLVWAKPYSTEHIDCYELQARVSMSTTWEPIASQITGQSLDVQDLIPATAYSFRVVPHYAFSGWGDAQKCSCSPLLSTDSAPPEPPVGFRVLDRTAHSITVFWEMPRCNGHIVESYALQYRCVMTPQGSTTSDTNDDGHQWIEASGAVPVDFVSILVDNLERGRAYAFRVSARNSLGEGAYLNHDYLVWTFPFLPPTAPVCVSKTSFSLHLEWQDLQPSDDQSREQLVYDVQLCQVDSFAPLEVSGDLMTWTTVAQNLHECSFAVFGLSPLGCYVFRIRAQAVSMAVTGASAADGSVFSPVSSVFQTQRRM